MQSSPGPGDEMTANRPPPQPTTMVTGPADRLLESVALRLFDERAEPGDGAVVVTTRAAPQAIVGRLTAGPEGFDPRHLAVVDGRAASEPAAVEAGRLRSIAADAAPPEIEREVRECLDWLDELGVDRRHFLFDALAADRPDPDPGATYDRAYELAMTVGADEGLAVVTVDPAGLSAEAVGELAHLFDVHVRLRDDGDGPELRWTGLLGESAGWLPVREVDFGHSGFR